MKPFLGINITENKKNDTFNGDEFIVAKASEIHKQALDNASDDVIEVLEKANLSLPLRIATWVSGILSILLVSVLFKAMTGEEAVGLSEAYNNASWIFWVAGLCIIVWLVLFILGRKKEKEIMESDESHHASARFDSVIDSIFDDFKIPEDAYALDVLSFKYKLKNGEPIAKETDFDLAPYTNYEYKAFTDDNMLYLADADAKYALDITEIQDIQTINKSITVDSWNKDTPANKGEFKPYKIKIGELDVISFKPYHILRFKHNGEEWGLYFPCYELPTIEKLTGINIE